MATTSFAHSNPVAASSAAVYNAYFSAIVATFSTFGWVQTADTGQINLTTNPSLITVLGSYIILRMDDTLQATAPVYLKIQIHVSTSFAIITLQLGKLTDGAGNFVGDVSQQIQIQPTSAGATANSYTTYASGDTNRIWFGLLASNAGATTTHFHFFAIERSKDALGADTGDFVTLIGSGGIDANARQCSLHYTYGPTQAENRWVTAYAYNSTNLGFGTGGGTLPVFPLLGRLENPLLDVGVCKNADFPHLSNITCTAYSATHTYKVLLGQGSNTSVMVGVAPTVNTTTALPGILARWE